MKKEKPLLRVRYIGTGRVGLPGRPEVNPGDVILMTPEEYEACKHPELFELADASAEEGEK